MQPLGPILKGQKADFANSTLEGVVSLSLSAIQREGLNVKGSG